MTSSEDEIIDALKFQAELANPYFGAYKMVTDPSWENFARLMYWPGIATTATAMLYFSPLVGPIGS